MPVMQTAISAALDSAIKELIPAAAEMVDPGKGRLVFRDITDGRNSIKLSSIHAEGSFQAYGAGEQLPNQTVFEGATVTVNYEKFGGMRGFDFATEQEVAAAANGDLRTLAENWTMGAERTRDKVCSKLIKNNATIYDSKALFATDHPQLSKTGAGAAYSNLNATVIAVSVDALRAIIKQMAQTSAVGENGEPIENEPDKFAVGDWEDYQELLAIIRSEKKPGGFSNDINTLVGIGDPLYWRGLAPATGTTRYLYAINTKRGVNGLLYWDQAPFTTEAWYDPSARQTFASGGMHGAAACINWRSIFRQAVVA